MTTEKKETTGLGEDLNQGLNRECAKIPWAELQRFFASGIAVQVDKSLDLIEVAALIHQDRASEVERLMNDGLLAQVSDTQAQAWFDQQAEVWAIVIKPWVLVQGI
ncbi:DUF2288 domain-containing protein [Agaribacterium haliotis]|uniref:DUF2288 domain-containing protein n=1 Tax=Agaribacterium haliotis TaxID=2013869 RepID=UPI000BB59F62|nr:DUF2288 domain-containing protein [Agaribacterium haliotis]